MSLRQIAKILGVSHSHLSQMRNGKRPWNTEVKARYEQLLGQVQPLTATTPTTLVGNVPNIGMNWTESSRIKSPMLYQTELPAHNDIIKAFIRDKKLSGLAPRTLQFYHEKLEKLPSDQCVFQLRKEDI